MKIGFVVNDIFTEEKGYTTTRLAMTAINRGHNEAVLQGDQESEQTYITTQEALDETYGPGKIKIDDLRRQWSNIVKDNYWDIWFDDNVGEFLVQINYEPSDEQD